MSLTIRRRAAEAHNPILAILGASESDEAAGRLIKSLLTENPGAVLQVSFTRPEDVEEMKREAEQVKSDPQLLLEEEREIRPGGV